MSEQKYPMPALTEQEREEVIEAFTTRMRLMARWLEVNPDDGDAKRDFQGYQITIAALTAEPAGYLFLGENGMAISPVDWQCDGMKLQGPLYTTPPVPVLKPDSRATVRADHADWSQQTFGNVGPIGPLKHLSKEAMETAEAIDDLSEWADMQFLLWDAQRRAGISDDDITQAMIDKLEVNKARSWPEPKDGEPRLHIKGGAE